MVWIGSTLTVVGVTISGLIYHRLIWAKLIPAIHGTTVYIGGTAYKGHIDFDREFERFVEKLKSPAHQNV